MLLPSSARDVKQGCSLRTHAFKIMRRLKRTWMTKRKSRGPETNRSCRHAQTPRRRNVAAYGRAIENGHIRISSSAQGDRQRKKRKKNLRRWHHNLLCVLLSPINNHGCYLCRAVASPISEGTNAGAANLTAVRKIVLEGFSTLLVGGRLFIKYAW